MSNKFFGDNTESVFKFDFSVKEEILIIQKPQKQIKTEHSQKSQVKI